MAKINLLFCSRFGLVYEGTIFNACCCGKQGAGGKAAIVQLGLAQFK